MKTKDNSEGMLYQMIHQGSKVISRKSLKIRIPYKNWDTKLNRVKNNQPESETINQQIEKVIREFNKVKYRIPDGDDRQCAIQYIKNYLDEPEIKIKYPITTIRKYKNIINNIEYVMMEILNLDSLPFSMLRDIMFVKNLKLEIRKNFKKEGGYKKNITWFNYMSVFGTLVEKWNSTSGTQFPINTKIFTSDIPKDEGKYANTLTRNEICDLEEYESKGYKNGESQLLAKNIFLFQYYTGGIRIQDTLTLTNKAIKSDGIEIKIKKSKRNQKFPFCYEQVECLKKYYPEEYQKSEEICKVSDLEISANTLVQLYRLDGTENSNEKLNEQQAYLIHRANTTHNSNLKRISKNMGFCVIGGHTPRHSIAGHMHAEGESPELIRDTLVHASLRTTQVYLKERHGNPKVSDSMKRSVEQIRKIKKQKEKRGF